MSALRARRVLWCLTLLGVVAFAGCTNPEYSDGGFGGDACAGEDTTAPVPGDECPTGEEGTGSPENDSGNDADADLGPE